MIVLEKYHINNIELLVGIPTKSSEKERMFEIRRTEYLKRGYTSPHYLGGSDIDKFDNNGCEYFIVKHGDEIIGTVRLIREKFLPTETECFSFVESQDIKKVPRDQRAEISRLIVSCADKNIPMHTIMIVLLNGITKFGGVSDIGGGYAFIKKSLHRIFQKQQLPIHAITPYKLIYSEKLLRGYFENQIDKAVPIYFLRSEIEQFFENFFWKRGAILNTLLIDDNPSILKLAVV